MIADALSLTGDSGHPAPGGKLGKAVLVRLANGSDLFIDAIDAEGIFRERQSAALCLSDKFSRRR